MPSQSIVDNLQGNIQCYQAQQFTGLVKVSAQGLNDQSLHDQGLNDQNLSVQNLSVPSLRTQRKTQINQPDLSTPHEWFICFLLGRIVWVKSRTHTLRRWKRSLCVHSPELFQQINQHPDGIPYQYWHYTALARLVKLKQYPRTQFFNVVESTAAEDLFDILQVGTQLQQQSGQSSGCVLTYEENRRPLANLPVLMIEQEHAWRESQQDWKAWERAELTDISPDWAPVITQMEMLRVRTSPQTFQTLTAFINGKNTLRDLAIQFRQSIVPLTKSILPYISGQLPAFNDIPDLVENADHGFPHTLFEATQFEATQFKATPVETRPVETRPVETGPLHPTALRHKPKLARADTQLPSASTANSITFAARPSATKPAIPRQTTAHQAVPIIYIDDSPADSQSMSEIIEGLGYQYTNIPDPIQALPLLLEIKPKLIFLDLVMPVANGYEVCAQIRRISAFKNTPIIIVTSNDGIADRVRARLVGASGFLGKPIQLKKVAKVLTKHLPGTAPHHRQNHHRPKQKGQQPGNTLYSR
ncbi:MAG: response regulator [Cyanobacteria bacterium P01_F01_bin.53]